MKNGEAWQLKYHQIKNIDKPLRAIRSRYAKEAAEFILGLPKEDQQIAWLLAEKTSFELVLALLHRRNELDREESPNGNE